VRHDEKFETDEDLNDAVNWKWKLLEYDRGISAQTVEAQVALAHAQSVLADSQRVKDQKLKEAEQAIREFVGKHPQEKEMAQEVAAGLYELIGDWKRAEELYRGLATSRKPERLALLARFLGKRLQTDEALNLCEELGSKLSPERAGALALDVLNSAKSPTPAQCQRVLTWVKAAQEKKPDSVILFFYLAGITGLQGDYPASERYYRELLQRDPKNAVALNNLAWQMALCKANLSEALDMVNKAIELSGPAAELLDTRSVIQLMLNQPDKALEDSRKAIRDSPTGNLYFHLAQAEYLSNQGASSRERAKEKLRLAINKHAKTTLHPLELKAYNELKKDLDLKEIGE
jgi:tetratricopeptide (TPR) repeat protein